MSAARARSPDRAAPTTRPARDDHQPADHNGDDAVAADRRGRPAAGESCTPAGHAVIVTRPVQRSSAARKATSTTSTLSGARAPAGDDNDVLLTSPMRESEPLPARFRRHRRRPARRFGDRTSEIGTTRTPPRFRQLVMADHGHLTSCPRRETIQISPRFTPVSPKIRSRLSAAHPVARQVESILLGTVPGAFRYRLVPGNRIATRRGQFCRISGKSAHRALTCPCPA